jgi:hypothetical protein
MEGPKMTGQPGKTYSIPIFEAATANLRFTARLMRKITCIFRGNCSARLSD